MEDELISRLSDEFTSEQQQTFLKYFQLYIGYGNDNTQYVVDLDGMWSWMGFSKKSNAKRLLLKHFTEDIDYKVVLLTSEQNLKGGRPTEEIKMNIVCFKHMCMLSNSEKGKETRTYYTKMETVFFQYMDEKNKQTLKALEEKNKLSHELLRHNTLKEAHRDEPCVYIVKISQEDDENMVVKLGETDDICQRITSLRYEYTDCLLMNVFPCDRPHKFEQYLLKRPDILTHRIMGTELIQISPEFTYKQLVQAIEKNIDFFDRTPMQEKLAFAKAKCNETLSKERQMLLERLDKAKDDNERGIYLKLLENISHPTNVTQDQEVTSAYAEPASNRIVEKYTLDDLETPIETFASLREASRSLNDPKVRDYHLRDAATNNRVLGGFRWYYVDNDVAAPCPLPPTMEDPPKKNMRRQGLIAQLTANKDLVIAVFASMKEAAVGANIASCSITCAMNKERPCGGFCWRMWEDCDKDLQATFTGMLPKENRKTCSKQVEQVDPNTDQVVDTFSSIQEISSKFRICHKTMNKVVASGDVYKGYKWRFV